MIGIFISLLFGALINFLTPFAFLTPCDRLPTIIPLGIRNLLLDLRERLHSQSGKMRPKNTLERHLLPDTPVELFELCTPCVQHAFYKVSDEWNGVSMSDKGIFLRMRTMLCKWRM